MAQQYSQNPYVCIRIDKDTGDVECLMGNWVVNDLADEKLARMNRLLSIATPSGSTTWSDVVTKLKSAISSDSGVSL